MTRSRRSRFTWVRALRSCLAGRDSEGLPIARLRASGRLLEIGATDLALDDGETRAVLEQSRVSIAADEAALLAQRTEGWAIAAYLAAQSVSAGGTIGGALAFFSGGADSSSTMCARSFSPASRRRTFAS